MADSTVLLVDDEESVRESLSEILDGAGYTVTAASSGEEALEAAKKSPPDILVTDLRLPGMDGIDTIRSIKGLSPAAICIVITGYATVESAVEAMRAGAFTYLKKPFGKDELLVTLEKARAVRALERENIQLKREIKNKYAGAILGTSARIQRIRDLIDRVADTDSTVLILGESGTGKELVARALHYRSSRADKPFVPINCAAIPEDLLESELFGHEKGAFTGAIATKTGRFEIANGGTVFLDEIGDMSPGLQIKILRVLQEKEFERIGGRKTIKVDVRVVAATNQDLEQAVKEKRFREDLFYRLNVIPIQIPPLRERKEDIPLLALHFVKAIAGRNKKEITGIDPRAMKLLESYNWPGNVRELENLIERLVVLKDRGQITVEDLPERFRQGTPSGAPKGPYYSVDIPPEGVDFNALVDRFETDLILNALQSVNGVKKKAAELLHINRTTLIEKMKRKGLLEGPDSTGSE